MKEDIVSLLLGKQQLTEEFQERVGQVERMILPCVWNRKDLLPIGMQGLRGNQCGLDADAGGPSPELLTAEIRWSS